MESWQNGRREILEVLTSAYDRIGANFKAELDLENNTLIGRDTLQDLHTSVNNKSARVEELEENVANAARERRALDAKLNDAAQLAQDKTAENEKLVQENAQLSKELLWHRNYIARSEELEKENQRLAAELEQSIQQHHEPEQSVVLHGEDTTLRSSNENNQKTSSARRIEYDGGPVSIRDHQSLVTKYNILHDNWLGAKKARSEMEKRLRDEKGKNKQWVAHADWQDNQASKKKDKIKQLEEEIRSLRMLENITRAMSLMHLDHIQYKGGVVSFEDIATVLNLPVLDELVAACHRIQVPNSSPSRTAADENIDDLQVPVSGHREEIGNVDGKMEYESPDLPLLLSGGINGDASVDDTQFEDIEPHHSSSTQDEFDSAPVIHTGEQITIKAKPPSSPETPVIIAVRSVRRRKGHEECGQPQPRPRIKTEVIPSSSPIGIAAFHGLDPNESLDLDAIGDKQLTPRKKRPFVYSSKGRSTGDSSARGAMNESRHADEAEALASYGLSTHKSNARNVPSPRVSALRALSTNKQILPRATNERASKRRRIASDLSIDELADDGENFSISEKGSEKVHTPEFTRLLNNLLEMPSAAKRTISRDLRVNSDKCSIPPTRIQQNQTSAFCSDGVLALPTMEGSTSRISTRPTSRDSAYASRPSSREIPVGQQQLKKPAAKGFSKSLADSLGPISRASPVTLLLKEQPLSPPRERTRMSLEFGNTATKRTHDTGRKTNPRRSDTSVGTTVAKRQSRAAEDIFNTAVDHPDNEPLRARPVETLTVEDFKINPNYNQGYKYAFNEVVRGKADRRCLQGCTKPECCGNQFRALAQAELAGRQPLTPSQEDREFGMLKEFLGDNAYKLRIMTEAEWKDVLLQAKTREIAKKFGKHRHAYERPSTPPGYWRMDFPTTQEQKEDREKALARQRETVKMRWMEAMRPNGAYKFRDE